MSRGPGVGPEGHGSASHAAHCSVVGPPAHADGDKPEFSKHGILPVPLSCEPGPAPRRGSHAEHLLRGFDPHFHSLKSPILFFFYFFFLFGSRFHYFPVPWRIFFARCLSCIQRMCMHGHVYTCLGIAWVRACTIVCTCAHSHAHKFLASSGLDRRFQGAGIATHGLYRISC